MIVLQRKSTALALLLAAGWVLAAGCGGNAAPKSAPAPATNKAAKRTAKPVDVESKGRELYETKCSACHGQNLKGGLAIGNATSADIRWSTLKSRYTSALIERAILQGLDEKGQPLDTAMPRWQGKLSTSQVGQIIAYLKTK